MIKWIIRIICRYLGWVQCEFCMDRHRLAGLTKAGWVYTHLTYGGITKGIWLCPGCHARWLVETSMEVPSE